jgi:cytochrome d ubiquinol oxidase subunit II
MPAPEDLLLGIMFLSLTLYTLWGGADFGAGVWEFNTAFSASDRERDLIYRAVRPVWEANHVWLIFVIVALHTAFPIAFAALSQALWLPLALAMAGVVFRGVGFTFRSYALGAVRQKALWGGVFALASTATPFFLGASAGAVASGRLEVTEDGRFRGSYLTGWLSPLSLFTGFLVVGLCAYLAAVYLVREARQAADAGQVVLWRRRALASGVWMGILATTGLVLVALEAPALSEALVRRGWPLIGLSIAAGVGSMICLLRGRLTAAALVAGLAASSIIWGWGVAQYPLLVPPAITVEAARSPDGVLWVMIAAIGGGTLLVVPSLAWLFYLFKAQTPH